MFSKTLLMCVMVGLVLYSCAQKDKKLFRKDYTYIEEVQSFYKLHSIPLAWPDAKKTCAQEGAIFWHPDNDEEAEAVLEFWNTTKPRIEWVYVGLNSLAIHDVWATVDGKPEFAVYNNWQPDTPDNDGGDQFCVYMYLKEGPGYLDDWSCHERYSFICKKTLQSLQWNYLCNSPNLDYTYNKHNGKCYKLHTTPLNWTEAYAVCPREQSSLAVIKDRKEAAYLAKLTELTPKPRLKENYHRGIFHVGFHNKLNEGWETVKGVKINYLDQDIWYDHYAPDGDNQCGAMFHTGRVVNIDCDTKSFFICEHEVDTWVTPLGIHNLSISEPNIGGGIK